MVDHRQWHLRYDIIENKKSGVKKLIPKISVEFTIEINLTPSNAWFEWISLRLCIQLATSYAGLHPSSVCEKCKNLEH